MCRTAGPLSPKASTANSLSERAPARAPATSRTGPSAGRPSCPRASSRGTGRALSGIARPVTTYFGGLRPGIGYERRTRLANGAARRLARPSSASASVSAAGMRRRAAAMTIGPATYPPPPSTASGRRFARIRSQAAGAANARSAARACSMPGRRGSPLTRNVSSSKPASGTSRASARSGDPANVTRAPRFRSASPIASAGRTCPAVPPAAIRNALCSRSCIARDVKEDPDAGERDHEARAAVRDKRQRNPGQRREPHHRSEVDRRLAADERGQAGREPLAEGVLALQRDLQAEVGEGAVGGDHGGRADEAKLLADDGEDHVRVRLREVVHLLNALAEAHAEDPAGAEPDHRLHGLEAGPLRVLPRVEEAEQARAAVRLEPDGEQAERGDDPEAGTERPARRARDEQHRGKHHDDRNRGSEVGLDQDQPAEDERDEADRAPELGERARRLVARQVA